MVRRKCGHATVYPRLPRFRRRDRVVPRLQIPARLPIHRQVRSGAHRQDAGQDARVILQLLTKARVPGRSVIQIYLRQRHRHDQHVFGIESRAHPEQLRHALDHQSRTGQDNHGQRHFSRHQNIAKTVAALLARSARALFDDVVEIGAQDAQSRSQSKSSPVQHEIASVKANTSGSIEIVDSGRNGRN